MAASQCPSKVVKVSGTLGPGRTVATYLSPLIAVAMTCVVVAVYAGMEPDSIRSVIREDGPVESASALLYFVVAGWILVLSRIPSYSESRFLVASALVSVLFGLRELDFNTRFTTDSVTKINYFLDPMISLEEHLMAGTVMVLIIGGFIAYAVAYAPRLRAALHVRSPAGISLLTVVVLLPLTKVIDRLPNKLKEDEIMNVSESTRLFANLLEEVLELGIPALMLLALVQSWYGRGGYMTFSGRHSGRLGNLESPREVPGDFPNPSGAGRTP